MTKTLGAQTRIALLCLAAATLVSCQKADQPALAGAEVPVSPAVTDTASAAGRKIEILTRGGACYLRVDGDPASREIRLAPKAPCHFLRGSNGSIPQVFAYEDVKIQAVLIVSGTPASESVRKTWNLEPGLVCGEESQGVLVRGAKVFATKAVRRGGVSCRDKGVDEKEYWAFAHDEK